MKTLFISDLDGTLLNADSKVSPESARMLNEAVAEGALFSVATARTPATLSLLLKDVDMRIPEVVMTGVTLWNPSDNSYSEIKHFPADTVSYILEVYRSCGLPAFLYTLSNNLIRIYHTGPLSDMERKFIAERANSPYKRFFIPDSGVSILPDRIDDAVLFFAMQPDNIARKAFDILRHDPRVSPVFYFDPTYGKGLAMSEAFPPDANKALAAKRLAERVGADRIVAFGDNFNDLPLLRAADVAVAVGNAIPEVKEAADIVIGPNTDDSVAKFILDNYD